jgi:predicted TIM-barrel enzyme
MLNENVASYIDLADGFIVGSSLRKDGAFLFKKIGVRKLLVTRHTPL